MPQLIHRITPVMLGLIIAGTAFAASHSNQRTSVIPFQTQIKRINDITSPDDVVSAQHRINMAQRADDIFTLFASELKYRQGKTDAALAINTKMLERTQDPEVAKRAMEMALGVNKIIEAETISQRWQEIEHNENSEKQRLSWELALAKNDVPQILKGVDGILSNANDYELRKLFLKLSQFRLNNLNVTDELNTSIHKAASLHPEMAEALIADAIYGVTGNHETQTIQALKQLAILDTEISPATQLTLNLTNVKHPQYLINFYQKVGVQNLPARWQSLYVEILIKNNKLQEAYSMLKPLLVKSKSADLYLQAMFLSINQKASTDTIISYAEKVVELGNQNQRSKAAMMAAIRFYDEHNIAASRLWATKVTDQQFTFDKAIIMTSLECEEKHWTLAQNWLNKAEAAKKQTTFFDEKDVIRLQTFINSSTLNPQQYEQQLTKSLTKAEQSKGNRENANVAPLLYLRGLLYADKLNQPEKAVHDLRRYIAMRPDQVDGLNALGYTMLSLSKTHWAEAQVLLEQAYQLSSQSPAVNDSLGWAYYLNGDAQKALPLLEYAYKHQPESEVAAHLGEVYWELGKQEEARKIWAQGWLVKNSDQKILKQTLNRYGIKSADLPLKKAKVVDGALNYENILLRVSTDYFTNVSEETFIKDVKQAMLSDNEFDRSAAAIMASSYFYQKKNISAALEWVNKVQDAKFEADKAYLMFVIEFDKKNFIGAKEWLQRLQQSKIPMMFLDKIDIMALTLALDKETMTPKAYLDKVNNLLNQANNASNDPDISLLLYARSEIYGMQLNKPQKAVEDLRKYVKREPDDANGWNNLGYTLLSLSKKHWAEALSILQHAYEIDSQSDVIKDSLGWAYYLNGSADKALPLLRSAFANLPRSEVAAHLGEVLWQLGQHEEARQIWGQGLTDKEGNPKVLQEVLKKFAIKPEELLQE